MIVNCAGMAYLHEILVLVLEEGLFLVADWGDACPTLEGKQSGSPSVRQSRASE